MTQHSMFKQTPIQTLMTRSLWACTACRAVPAMRTCIVSIILWQRRFWVKPWDATLAPAEIHFDYEGYGGKISILEPLIGKSGTLTLTRLSVEALDQGEDYLLFAAVTDQGQPLEPEQARRLWSAPSVPGNHRGYSAGRDSLARRAYKPCASRDAGRDCRAHGRFFDAELKKLDAWADDQIASSEKALKDIKNVFAICEMRLAKRETCQTRSGCRVKSATWNDASANCGKRSLRSKTAFSHSATNW